MKQFADFITRMFAWARDYSNGEIIVISLAILALTALLLYISVRVVDVMIFPDDEDDE